MVTLTATPRQALSNIMETPGSIVNNGLPCGSGDPAVAEPSGRAPAEKTANRRTGFAAFCVRVFVTVIDKPPGICDRVG
jgi:hypothetical protein